MNWIRIATGILNDPSIHAVADAAGVSVPTTTGHVVGVLSYLPDHARGGDLSGVSDATLERWAMWTGKRGKFAAAFRAYLCDAQGVVRSWEKHNGAAIRKLDADVQRKREQTKARRSRADVAPTSARPLRDVGAASSVDETRRDVTTPTEAVGVVRAPEAPHRPAASGRVAYQAQLDELLAAGMPHERAALQALVHGHPNPDVLVLELHATASGLHVIRGANTGRAADIADVMRAVAEMAAAAKPFNVSLFRGFVRRVADRPPEPASAEEREAARLAREIAARQPAVDVEPPRTQEELDRLRVQREEAMARFRAEFHRHTAGDQAA